MSDNKEFKDKLKNLSFPRKLGATERRVVTNEENGTVGGYHTIRWDGSQDATVTPSPVNTKTEVGEQ